MSIETRDIYNFNKHDPIDSKQPQKKRSLWRLLVKATLVFIPVTLGIFFVVNYQFVKSQILDFNKDEKYENYTKDQDGDGLPDWWEIKYQLSPTSPIDAKQDGDNDRASNLLEYQFSTNPTDSDTDKDSYLDGDEIINGYNPNGIGRIDTDKDGLYDWWEESNGLNKNDLADANQDNDRDNLTNKEEFFYKTNPNNSDSDQDGITDGNEVKSKQNPMGEGTLQDLFVDVNLMDEDQDKLTLDYEVFFGTDPKNKDTDNDGYDDYHELSRGYNPIGEGMIKGEIEIPAISVKSPVIWSQNFNTENLENDLEQGIVHYPGSAFPSFQGNSYLTGHSSYYAWNKSNYKDILKDIDKLKKGDEIIFHLIFSGSRTVQITYEVAVPGEVTTPEDKRIFRDFEGHELTLVTCWPLGTNWKRIMVKADLKKPSFN